MERASAIALYDDEVYYPTVRAELIRHLLDSQLIAKHADENLPCFNRFSRAPVSYEPRKFRGNLAGCGNNVHLQQKT